MKTYRYLARPDRPVPFDDLIDRASGEVFEADFDQSTENYLKGIGAIEVVSSASKAKPDPKPDPKKEAPRATEARTDPGNPGTDKPGADKFPGSKPKSAADLPGARFKS